MASDDQEDRQGLAGSVQQLAADVAILIRHEVELAKAELSEKVKVAGIGAGMLSASAVTAFITLGCLTALIILLIALVLPGWLAALIATLLWAAVTVILVVLGKRKVEDAVPFVPEKTIENVKQDAEWARRRAKQL